MGRLHYGRLNSRTFVALTLRSKFKELLVASLEHSAASERYLSAEPTFTVSTVVLIYGRILTKWRELCL